MEPRPVETVSPALHWQDAEGHAQSFGLKTGESLVGRSAHCDVVILHRTVSREHAKILASEGIYLLVDLGTFAGTRVNGLPIRVCVLRSGDRIDFGKNEVTYRFEDASTRVDQSGTHESITSDLTLGPLEDLSAESVSGVLHAELRKSRGQRMELAQELLLAANIQRALLPMELPDIDGFRLRAFSRATRYVGGDFYDFVPTPTRSLCGVLGDVSGKGVAASLLSAMVQGCLDACLRTGSSLEDAVQTVNGLLHEKGDGRFVTLFLFRFDSGGRGRFVSAGHNPVYVYRHEEREVQEVSSNNTIVGPFPATSFQSKAIDLAPGDLMLIYSDGLTEAESLDNTMLGEEPVRRLLQENSSSGADSVRVSLLDLLDKFTAGQQQNDDITFIILQRL